MLIPPGRHRTLALNLEVPAKQLVYSPRFDMGGAMRVKPVGELVFEKGGHEHFISTSQLSQGEQKKEAGGIHGESEDWSVI